MNINITNTKDELGHAAAQKGAQLINAAIAKRGKATIIVATGASQFEMLENLVKENVDWSKVEAFHLDEYIGMQKTHPASFRRYLQERFVDKVGSLKVFHYIGGDTDRLDEEITRLNELVSQNLIDVAFVGVGENGHLAFNDPPADFEIETPYLVVDLDEACRKQQLGEGWFPTLEDVPKKAVSMSVRQIMKSRSIICTVPDERKAKAVFDSITGPVSNMCPASILQQHSDCNWYLDKFSSKLLSQKMVKCL